MDRSRTKKTSKPQYYTKGAGSRRYDNYYKHKERYGVEDKENNQFYEEEVRQSNFYYQKNNCADSKHVRAHARCLEEPKKEPKHHQEKQYDNYKAQK